MCEGLDKQDEIMNKYLILSLVAIFYSINSYAQFNGKILDSSTSKPIANATILTENTGGATTRRNGTFEINLSDYPVILKISHLSYHPVEIIINSHLQSGMNIYLKAKTLKLDVVEVRGERIKRYYQDKLFYLIDYDFIEDDICLIGYENNNLSLGRVLLMNQAEDTLAYLPADHPKRVYRDVFDNLHLITKDSVYQLYYYQPEFYQLYPSHRDEVPIDLFQLKFVSGPKFLFKQTSDGGQAHEYYYIDTISKTREDLKTVYNNDLYKSSTMAVRYTPPIGKLPGRAESRDMTTGSMEDLRDIYEAMVYDISIIHRPIYSLVFPKDTGFIIVDLVNNQINHFSEEFEFTEAVQTNFPEHKQIQKLVIQDPITLKLYWIHYKGSKVLLSEFDLYTGEITSILETPSFPFIENIKIRNGIIWFTYQPRLGETVRSLYRMN